MKNLNPLYEFLGHATAGLTGAITGMVYNDDLIKKETYPIYKKKLDNNPLAIKKEFSACLALYSKYMKECQDTIEYCREQVKELFENDPEEASYYETGEFEERILHYKEELQKLKVLFKQYLKDPTIQDELINQMYQYRTKTVTEIEKQLYKKHKLRSWIMVLGSAAVGTALYHFAKKGLIMLIKSIFHK